MPRVTANAEDFGEVSGKQSIEILVLDIHAQIFNTFKMTSSQSPDAVPSPERSSDTGFAPGDDTWTQWRNIFSILTGKMTDEGKEQFRVARDIRNEAADCKRCEDQRSFLLQYSG